MPYSAPNIVFRMRWMIGIALLAIAASTVALTGSRAALPVADAPVAAAETLPSLNPALADLAAPLRETARTPGWAARSRAPPRPPPLPARR